MPSNRDSPGQSETNGKPTHMPSGVSRETEAGHGYLGYVEFIQTKVI